MMDDEDLVLEANRIDKILLSLSGESSAILNPPELINALPEVSTPNILSKLEKLVVEFENNNSSFQQPSKWCHELRALLLNMNTTMNHLSNGGQVASPNANAFQPLERPTFWPEKWLWPLGKLSNIVNGPQYGQIVGYLYDTSVTGNRCADPNEANTIKTIDLLRSTMYKMSEMVNHKLYSKIMIIVTSSLESERWDHHQPHPYKLKRCSSGLMMWCMEMRSLKRKSMSSNHSEWMCEIYEKRLSEWLGWSGRDLISKYIELCANVSRARIDQYNIDITVLVLELSSLLGVLEYVKEKKNTNDQEKDGESSESGETKSNSKNMKDSIKVNNQLMSSPMYGVHNLFLITAMNRLLVVMALMCSPISHVLNFIQSLPPPKKKQKQVGEEEIEVNEYIELSGSPLSTFLNAIVYQDDSENVIASATSTAPTTPTTSAATTASDNPTFTNATTAYPRPTNRISPTQDVMLTGATMRTIEQLQKIKRPWEQMLMPGILQHRAVIECAYKRHELSEAWVYPPVDEKDIASSNMLLEMLNNESEKYQYDKLDVTPFPMEKN
jgi:hypothetical protein